MWFYLWYSLNTVRHDRTCSPINSTKSEETGKFSTTLRYAFVHPNKATDTVVLIVSHTTNGENINIVAAAITNLFGVRRFSIRCQYVVVIEIFMCLCAILCALCVLADTEIARIENTNTNSIASHTETDSKSQIVNRQWLACVYINKMITLYGCVCVRACVSEWVYALKLEE